MATAPAVTGVAADNAVFGKSSAFTINGSNLPSAVTPVVTGCSGLVSISSSSASSRQFTCTPDSLSVTMSVNYGGTAAYNATIAIPRPNVTLITSMGSVIIELYPEKAPVTVKNFLKYVNSGFYANTIFHRVIVNFMNQGGGFTANADGTLSQKANTTPPIVLESNNGLSNLKYSVAMARTSVADSATSQFFINAVDNTSLDYKAGSPAGIGYAVFGKVIGGTAIVDSMNKVSTTSKVATGTGVMADVPVTTVTIQSATQTQ